MARYPSFEVPPSPPKTYPDPDHFKNHQVSAAYPARQLLKLTETVVPVLHNYLSPDAAIDPSIFQDYIKLLSSSLPNKYFIEVPRGLSSRPNVAESITQQRVDDTILWPVYMNGEHSLALIYPDAIHWLSWSDHAVPDEVIGSAKTLRRRSLPLIKLQSQAVEQNSSGWLVLHAMQRILAGRPVVDFSDLTAPLREAALTHFKCEVLAATRAKTLKPNEEYFVNLVSDADQTQFFEDAICAMDDMFVTDHSEHSLDIIEPASGHMENPLVVAQDASGNRHGAPLVVQEDSSPGSSKGAPESQSRRRRSRPAAVTLDYRRIILSNISKAVRCYRSTHLDPEMSVPVLWSILERGPLDSAFLRRYTLILFYMKIKTLDDVGIKEELATAGTRRFSIKENSFLHKMRRKQEEGKAWSDLCDLKREWGQDKYTLLSAVPEDTREAPIQEMDKELQSENSVLLRSLNDARSLCAALLGKCLPNRLLIDNYIYKDSLLSDDEIGVSFGAFLSLNPRQPVQIPRC
ncbi:hypothetical protein ACKVV7_011428 [Pyricularia oryzae]